MQRPLRLAAGLPPRHQPGPPGPGQLPGQMRTPKSAVLGSRLVLGVVTILIVGLAVYLSYIAENGLPFLPTYRVNVQVANGDELDKNADVRVGGARVGQI